MRTFFARAALPGATYGAFLGISSVLLHHLLAEPTGSIIWWTAVAVQLTWGASLCWRRTGLPFATAAMAIGAATSACLVALAASGHVFPDLPVTWWLPVGAGLLSGPFCFFVESRVNRAKWIQWRAHVERSSVWAMFIGRHIPNLRDE